MDETAVSNMIFNTTVEKRGTQSVNLKSTGHEKSKITVCLTATADGGKRKPFFVFKGAKRDVKRLKEEYQSKCIVASSDNEWINEALTEQYCREVIRTFSFGTRRLLAWDAFRCHLTPAVNDILNRGCTKFIQAPDVSGNKPMKEYLRQMYNNWFPENEHQMTSHGNMKAPSRKQMIEWLLEAWKKLPAEVIKKSSKVCALSMVHAKACYLDYKHFTLRRKRSILQLKCLRRRYGSGRHCTPYYR